MLYCQNIRANNIKDYYRNMKLLYEINFKDYVELGKSKLLLVRGTNVFPPIKN